jgi:hypothetical protein
MRTWEIRVSYRGRRSTWVCRAETKDDAVDYYRRTVTRLEAQGGYVLILVRMRTNAVAH